MKKVDLSIIIVNWNVKEYLVKCIESILAKIVNINFEIIVVDNASTDGSIPELNKKIKSNKLFILENKINKGFAAANNQGYSIARGEIILFLNPDTLFLDGNINSIISKLKNNDNLGIATCKVLNTDLSIQKTCARYLPSMRRTIYDQLLLCNYVSWLEGKGEYYKDKKYNDLMYVECISGCFMLIKKNVLALTGVFDERYFMYGEDIEICNRIRMMGYKTIYCPEMSIIHYGGMSSKKNNISFFGTTKRYDSDYLLIRRIFGNTNAIVYRMLIIVGSLIRIFAAIVIHKGKKTALFNIIKKHQYGLRWGLGLLTLNQ